MRKERKRCPKCHEMGSGPFLKPVWPQRSKRIYHYWYFAHRRGDKLKWCYIGKRSKEREEDPELEGLWPGDGCPVCGAPLNRYKVKSMRGPSLYCKACRSIFSTKGDFIGMVT